MLTVPTAYLAQLRNLIRTDRRPKYRLLAHRHLDTATYRTNVQNEAQTTILALQARIAVLEGKGQAHPTFEDLAPEDQSRITIHSPGKRKRKVSDPGTMPTKLARQARLANSSSPRRMLHNNDNKRGNQDSEIIGSGKVRIVLQRAEGKCLPLLVLHTNRGLLQQRRFLIKSIYSSK